MTINNKFTIGSKTPVQVDGGDAMGEVRALTYRLDREGNEFINYEVDAEWHYQGKRFTKQIFATEAELEEWKK